MPTVPRLSSPDVNPATGPADLGQMTARAAPENFGASNAPIVDAASKLFEQAKNNADQVAVLDADKQMSALETKLLYDPQVGALNKKGKDAFGAVEKTNTDFQSAMDQVEQGLSNDVQKEAFREKYRARQEAVNRTLNQHVAGEISAYDTAQTQAFIQNQQNLAVANPYDKKRLADIQQSIIDTIYQHGQRNGLPEEAIKETITKATSQTHMEVVSKLIASGDDMSAEAYYKANSETFFGQDRINAEKLVRQSSLLGKGQRNGDDIFQRFAGSMTQAMSEVKKIADPEERKATEAQVLHNFSQKKLADNANEEEINKSAVSFIMNGGSPNDFLRRYTGKPGQKSALTTAQVEAIQKFATAKSEQSDGVLAYDLEQMAADPARKDDFASRDLHADVLKGDLSRREWEHFSPIQAKVRAKEDSPEFDNMGTRGQITREALLKMGYDPSESNKNPNIDKVISFNEQVRQAVDLQSRDLKRRLTREEVQKVVDDLSIRKVATPGWFWTTNELPYAFGSKEQQATTDINDFPPSEIQKASVALKSNGIPQTNENIVNALKEMQRMKNAASRKRARNYTSAY